MSDIPFIRFGFLSLVLGVLFICLFVLVEVFVFIIFRMRHSKYKIERNEEVTGKCNIKVNEKIKPQQQSKATRKRTTRTKRNKIVLKVACEELHTRRLLYQTLRCMSNTMNAEVPSTGTFCANHVAWSPPCDSTWNGRPMFFSATDFLVPVGNGPCVIISPL